MKPTTWMDRLAFWSVVSGVFTNLLVSWSFIYSKLSCYNEPLFLEHSASMDMVKPIPKETLSSKKPTVLLGIFSTSDTNGKSRRELTRSTYLQASNFQNQTRIIAQNRICPLPKNSGWNRQDNSCQVFYIFVTQSNDPTTHARFSQSEPDLLYLPKNKLGLTLSWFQYAVSHSQVDLDYIAKVAPTTVIDTAALLEFLDNSLRPYPENRRHYVGTPFDTKRCGAGRPHCYEIFGKVFMSSELYMLSSDLCQYLEQVNRTLLTVVEDEDLSMGNYIQSHPQPVHMIAILEHQQFWKSRVRTHSAWKSLWEENFSAKLAKDRRLKFQEYLTKFEEVRQAIVLQKAKDLKKKQEAERREARRAALQQSRNYG